MAAIVGIWHVLSGIAAIAEDDRTEDLAEVLYGVDITAWGWFWLVIGILQVIAAGLILVRNPIGQILGVIWATISASLAVFAIFVAPLWALGVLAIDVVVIWALIAYSDEFGTG
jgi:hypothetical protein